MMGALETTSTRNDENKVELTVSFSASDVQSYVDAVYKEAGKVRIPGFRPGKAPRRVLENYYGGKDYFLARATDDLMKDTLPAAIDEAGFVPLDKPSVITEEMVEESKDYAYVATFTVRPIFELSSYDPVQIELPNEEPTEEEIAEQVNTMLQYYIDYQVITDRPVRDKDFVSLALDVKADGVEVEPLCGENIPHEVGTQAMPDSFDEQLIGMMLGETKEFDFNYSADDSAKKDDSTPHHAIATIKEIKAYVKPELTDEWVKEKLEFDSAADFKERITDSLRMRKAQEITALKERLLAEELASRLVGEPPDVLITQTEQDMYREFFSSLQRNNQTFDAYLAGTNTTPEAFRESIKKQATEAAAQLLAFDALARHLGLEISDEETREEFELSGTEDPEALYLQWKETGRLSEVREGLLRVKASAYVDENAEIFAPGTKPAAKKPAKKAAKPKKAAEEAASEKDSDESEAADTAPEKAEKKPTAPKTAKSKAKSTEEESIEKESVTKKQGKAEEADNRG